MEDKMQSMLKNANKKSKRVIDEEEVFDLFGLDQNIVIYDII